MNLLHLFSSIVKYNLPFTNKTVCIEEIKQQFSDGGGVWQKFAQMLSGQGDIIGQDLATELQKMLFDCPAHDDAYSARIIKDAFGDKYDTKGMKMIGSGTISQVYKIHDKNSGKYVAIKVMHPDIKKEIKTACDLYDNIKESFLFPRQLRTITKLFFMGLREQLDMRKEFKNGKVMSQMWNGDVIIVPKMIDCSKKCIVMSYEESKLVCSFEISEDNKHMLMKVSLLTSLSEINMLYKGLFHLDLHPGNYGIRETNGLVQLVIYDFGQCGDLSKIQLETRIMWTEAFFTKNYHLWVKAICPNYYDKLVASFYKPERSFEQNVERTTSELLINDYQLDDNTLNICTGCIKIMPNSSLVDKLLQLNGMEQYQNRNLYKYGREHYITKYFPYPEFDNMKQLFIEFDKKL